MSKMNSDWFHEAGWGVFTHWCKDAASPSAYNARVDNFDVDRLVQQLVEIGTPYYFITLGQTSSYYCAPNPTYDRILGYEESHCSKRDLISDIADALAPHGIRLMLYLHANGPIMDPYAARQLKFIDGQTLGWDIEGNQIRQGRRGVEFLQLWQECVRDWSLRFGEKVHGWWVDACYWPEHIFRSADEPNYRSFAAAFRAGNPKALLAFNGGLETPVIAHSEYEDFTAGEIGHLLPVGTRRVNGALVLIQRFVSGGVQYHLLTHLGEHWGGRPSRFPTELVVGYTKLVMQSGGVMTWDVGLDETGNIYPEHFEQLKTVGAECQRGGAR